MPRRSNYNEKIQMLVELYRKAGEPWPATKRQIARWMIRNNHWDRSEASLVEMCARDIANAMREEYYTDPQGRRVRSKHAAKVPTPGADDGQETLWDDIRTASRPFMERAFKGRRDQIVGDCVQLNKDVKSYNENRSAKNPIPMLFDMRDDVAEAEKAEESKRSDVATAGTAPFDLDSLLDSPTNPAALPPIPAPEPSQSPLTH